MGDGDGVKVSYEDLEALERALQDIITEFEQASSRSDDLVTAIARPYGEGDLRDLAADFESRWDDRRGKLLDGLKTVHDRTKSSIEKWRELDDDMSQTDG